MSGITDLNNETSFIYPGDIKIMISYLYFLGIIYLPTKSCRYMNYEKASIYCSEN